MILDPCLDQGLLGIFFNSVGEEGAREGARWRQGEDGQRQEGAADIDRQGQGQLHQEAGRGARPGELEKILGTWRVFTTSAQYKVED